MKTVIVGTDGSSRGNPGRAGWAWVVDSHTWQAGSLPHETSIVAELTAVLRALTTIPPQVPVKIVTDSQFLVDVMTKYAPRWSRPSVDWRKRDGNPVENLALVQALWAAHNARSPRATYEHVRGHAGHPLNEAADRLATGSADNGHGSRRIAGPGWAH